MNTNPFAWSWGPISDVCVRNGEAPEKDGQAGQARKALQEPRQDRNPQGEMISLSHWGMFEQIDNQDKSSE